jgi:hypothetical protein
MAAALLERRLLRPVSLLDSNCRPVIVAMARSTRLLEVP